jgi:hypothetical protein
MKDWEIVYRAESSVRAEIVRSVLELNGIDAVVVDKKDRNYHLGFCEVLVRRQDILRALKIIDDDIRFR